MKYFIKMITLGLLITSSVAFAEGQQGERQDCPDSDPCCGLENGRNAESGNGEQLPEQPPEGSEGGNTVRQ